MKQILSRLAISLAASLIVILTGCSEKMTIGSQFAATEFASMSVEEMMAAFAADIEATIDPSLVPRETGGLSELSTSRWNSISSPTVITEQGFYRVTADFTATGDGIVIQSDNVVLRLGDYTITGPDTKVGRGIYVDGAKHVNVSGGVLTNFGIGVALNSTSESTVRGVNVAGADDVANPPQGIPPQIGILLVNSSENYVLGNILTLVNLGLFVRGSHSYENQISNNIVLGGDRGLLAICYNPAMGEGDNGPHADLVRHNFIARYGTGIQTSAGSADNVFRRNTIKYFTAPYFDFNGTNVFEKNRSMQISM